jgi:DNA-binding transcriptional LysR family regulator
VLSASLLVGTLSTSGAPLLGRAIDRLLTHYPGLTVKVVEEPYEHLLNDLLLGNIDFLFSILRRPDWATDVVEETLYRDDYVVVCRPGHPLNVPGELSLKDLARYRWIIPGPATPRSQAFHGLFAKQRRPVTDIVTTSRAITRAVIAGSDRLTLLTRHEARSEEALGVMRVLPFACKIPAPAYGVATRMDWAATTTQQQFLEILRDLAAETGIPAQPAVAGA